MKMPCRRDFAKLQRASSWPFAALLSQQEGREVRRRCRFHAGMHIEARGVGGTEDRPGASHFLCRAVRHHQKAVGFQSGLVLDHAVPRNADAGERRAERAQPADHDSGFDARDRDGGQIAQHDDMPDDRNGHEQPAKEQAPQTAPERAPRPPELDPVADIVEADDLFIGMVSLADNAEAFICLPRYGAPL